MSVTSYAKSKIDSLLSGAAGLAGTTPLAPIVNGFAGSANNASRGDHQHPLDPAKPAVVGLTTGTTGTIAPIGSNAGTSLNRANFGPIWISTFSRAPLVTTVLGVWVASVAGSGGTVRFAVYKADASGMIDFTNKLTESGEISSTSTGFKSISYTTPIPEGLYWVGVVPHTNATGLQIVTAVHGISIQNPSNAAQHFSAMYIDGVTGAFPTSGANVNGDIAPNLVVTVA